MNVRTVSQRVKAHLQQCTSSRLSNQVVNFILSQNEMDKEDGA